MRQTTQRVLVISTPAGVISYGLSEDDDKAIGQIRTWSELVPVPSVWMVKHSALREATAPEEAA